MPSSFAWLDFSESDRQRALDVVDLFREKGTVDELGIGTIRDAIADLLFPGTSTIMTRAKYYLFVPWVYRRLEDKKIPSSEAARVARQDEIAIITALRAAGESRGVIGIDAGEGLKRLPSTVYWQSLGTLGIRRFAKSIDHYHRALDSFYRRGGDVIRGDDKHVLVGGNNHRWDPALPKPPQGFPRTAMPLALTPNEANYLRERIIQAAPNSLFAYLVNIPLDHTEFRHPWDHPGQANFPARNREELRHARNFAEVMHGAALLYNLMLAQKNKDEDRIDGYEDRFDDWVSDVDKRQPDLVAWKQDDFWTMVTASGARIPHQTRVFVSHWLAKVIGNSLKPLPSSKPTRDFIAAREKTLKGQHSRLDSPRSLNWGGASSAERLDYRWNRPVRAILADIRAPLD